MILSENDIHFISVKNKNFDLLIFFIFLEKLIYMYVN
jgi:hypothetical protein